MPEWSVHRGNEKVKFTDIGWRACGFKAPKSTHIYEHWATKSAVTTEELTPLYPSLQIPFLWESLCVYNLLGFWFDQIFFAATRPFLLEKLFRYQHKALNKWHNRHLLDVMKWKEMTNTIFVRRSFGWRFTFIKLRCICMHSSFLLSQPPPPPSFMCIKVVWICIIIAHVV